MLNTLLPGLLLAIISGLTYLAYKHPKGYQKIFYILLPISFFVPFIITAANLGGAHSSIQRLAEDLARNPSRPIQEVSHSITALRQNEYTVHVTLVVGAIVIGYLTFLFFLQRILGADAGRDKAGGDDCC